MSAQNNPPSLPGRFGGDVLLGQVVVSLASGGTTALGLAGASGLYPASKRIVITSVVLEDPATSATLATTHVSVGTASGTGAGSANVVADTTLTFTASGAVYQNCAAAVSGGSATVQGADVYLNVQSGGVASATAKATLRGYIE